MGKYGNLQITILNIGSIKMYEYKPTKKNKLISLDEIIDDFEKRVESKINGECDSDCLDFDTNYGYDHYSIHFDEWIKKYDLTVSIFHSYGNDNDHGDRTEFYYLGKYAVDYTLENLHMIHIDDIINHTLNKTNAKIIKIMQDNIYTKVVELLKKQNEI